MIAGSDCQRDVSVGILGYAVKLLVFPFRLAVSVGQVAGVEDKGSIWGGGEGSAEIAAGNIERRCGGGLRVGEEQEVEWLIGRRCGAEVSYLAIAEAVEAYAIGIFGAGLEVVGHSLMVTVVY